MGGEVDMKADLDEAAKDQLADVSNVMNDQDKQFLACLCVWLDWSAYQSVNSIKDDWNFTTKSFKTMRLEAKELVEQFSKPPEE